MLEKIRAHLLSRINYQPDARDKGEYFSSVGRNYSVTGLAFLVLAGIFVLFSLICGYKELTYDNIYYFIKDFDTVISSESYSADAVDYGTGENRSYYCYRGGVVAAGKYTVSVHSSTGRKTADFNNEYLRPIVRTSSKYMLIYDAEGNSFSICNSFIRLYSETLDRPVYSADINDRGEALIHTSTPEYRSVLYLYNSGFDRAAAYYLNDYVTCSALSDDGKYIFAATVDATGGEYAASLKIYRRGETEPGATYTINGALPLACGSLNNGCYIITEHGLTILDINANVIDEMPLADGQSIIEVSSDENGVAVLFCERNDYYLIYASAKGNTMTVKLDSKASCVNLCGAEVYLLYEGAVACYDLTRGTYELRECAPGVENMFVAARNCIYLCYASRAIFFEF